ncbi:ATP-binding protein [Fredinandcohnia humi]
MKSGIKARLVWSYLLLIILTVVIFEIIILAALRFYYVEGMKDTLINQGTMFATFYKQKINDGDFMKEAPVLVQSYDFFLEVQVQIINTSGEIVADTHKSDKRNLIDSEDVISAFNGEIGSTIKQFNGEEVLSITQPLVQHDTVIGAIRLTTSTEQMNKIFKNGMLLLVSVGCFVIVLAAVFSYFLATTITKPLKSITAAAEQMAAGKFSIRITKDKDDELGKLADTLNFMAEEVENHERLKNEFIASVSHELRTPLTSVKGWAITLHSMAEDPFFQEGLDIISNESDRLSILLGDLLDLSNLSAGNVKYTFENVSINSLLHQVVTQLSPRANRQGVELKEEYEVQLEAKVDINRLKQVLINVIDNALKFTPSNGEISVRLCLVDSLAKIQVVDTGSGIPEEELELVKKKFFKGKTKASGTGLGLAICQEIMMAHDGTLKLMSEVGRGTTVELMLPVVQSESL